jgi:PIN domain nuclease of toxin-antitoxin system
MKGYLLDTHAFLWWVGEPERLPGKLIERLSEKEAALYLSVASCWEIQIKAGLGRLQMREDLETIVKRETDNNALQILPILFGHTLCLKELPPLHRDPFDRMLVAQAIDESLVFVSRDPAIAKYPRVDIVWDS